MGDIGKCTNMDTAMEHGNLKHTGKMASIPKPTKEELVDIRKMK